MAYHGYIPIIHGALVRNKNPKILEIGICDGISLFSLIQRLSRTHESFEYFGVDVLVKEQVIETLKYMMFSGDQFIKIFNQNSLTFLSETSEKFDIILYDGDHNYYTVLNELKFLDKISHDDSIVICDDYDGRWSETDLFYSERIEYAENKLATPRISLDKSGVKSAIDDFLLENPVWKKEKIIQGEPLVLTKSSLFEIIQRKNEQ